MVVSCFARLHQRLLGRYPLVTALQVSLVLALLALAQERTGLSCFFGYRSSLLLKLYSLLNQNVPVKVDWTPWLSRLSAFQSVRFAVHQWFLVSSGSLSQPRRLTFV